LTALIIIRGGGDLATGVAARLHRSGFDVVITEIERPRAIRRLVALAEAVYAQTVDIEDLHGLLIPNPMAARATINEGHIPILVDPDCECREALSPDGLIDARMLKKPPEMGIEAAPVVIGLGPGFEPGVDCHAVVETKRGHHLGRVYWQESVAEDTSIPEPVSGFDVERVLRAPAAGTVQTRSELGTILQKGELVAEVGGKPLLAPFTGALRGLMHDGLTVQLGEKVGDLDPRGEAAYCSEISDKALAVGGGVLEALLSYPRIRESLGV
jgi:xanthine dehydrogenase accessory factor